MESLNQKRSPARGPRRGLLVLAGITVALVLAACGETVPASGDVTPGAAEGAAIKVIALDNEFKPDVLELEPGTEVTIEVDNQGQRPHNLVIDELDLSTGTLEAGDVATATFTVPETDVTFFCSFHPGMEGQIRPSAG